MDALLTKTLLRAHEFVAQPFKQEDNSPFFVYGTGSVGRDIYRILTEQGFSIAGFMDHRLKETPSINGVQIFDPASKDISSSDRKACKIVLAIHNREANIPSIIGNLKKLGYLSIISIIDLYDFFAEYLGTRYSLTSRTFYQSNYASIEKVYKIWSDGKSRETYSALLRFRITGDFSLLPEPDTEHQYSPLDIPRWFPPLRLIDCGAYDGTLISSFIDSGMKLEAVAFFEPDLENYQFLSQSVRNLNQNISELSLWPCGVYSTTTQMQFISGQGEASGVSAVGNTIVQCVALDDALPNFAPTLIKMDIEGAEIEALHGAQNIIQKYKPGLAISVYHAPEHIWEIPLLIREMLPNTYQYYLRSHAYNDFDTVFYAIPI